MVDVALHTVDALLSSLTVRALVPHPVVIVHVSAPGCAVVLEVLGHDGDRELVGGHHNGGVRDLPDQLRGQAPVQPSSAFLAGHRGQGAPERAVLGALLAHARPRHL